MQETGGHPLYRLSHVDFEIGGKPLLHDISLDIGAGEVVGLIGHNGSGKTSLIRLLARLHQPTRGTIEFDGQPLASLPHRRFAQQVAHLPQTTPATDGLLVRELVALGRYPWHGALGRFTADDRRRVDEAMAWTDVAHYADRPVDSLSGGERQRVWLAMLIAQDSRCVLLDEPTSALDIGHQLGVLGLVRKLCDEHGMTAVIVLHDVNMATRFCTQLISLRGGKLLMQTDPAGTMRADVLQAIYGVPMGVMTDSLSGHLIGYPR
ncbi:MULTISPECIES: ATP-binding cassette domain-containing protein [unclassified Caballeronia]|uniref:ABC transporter ATP-binding protein n=1 Tax=unclassified Caballeronia TaxID=2646786 RepID=UPI0028572C7B|nr:MULTISPECIES: ATP-binding cassette domain-containing protein [unclassified Caballeronia]MDR5776826.1 ATP-binding cassette domain-containing protein [Caballeronia sp. LZ002]MDR5798685.1 ATP-binding cassette domain-containing protein [Caballeronia sp. LZ001]MDR5852266.1 ATP-binding cassette domain-containing protein [Caballeronia sp. LZ003]